MLLPCQWPKSSSVADNFSLRLSQYGKRAYQDVENLADSFGNPPQHVA